MLLQGEFSAAAASARGSSIGPRPLWVKGTIWELTEDCQTVKSAHDYHLGAEQSEVD
jgi:hypothetical protein